MQTNRVARADIAIDALDERSELAEPRIANVDRVLTCARVSLSNVRDDFLLLVLVQVTQRTLVRTQFPVVADDVVLGSVAAVYQLVAHQAFVGRLQTRIIQVRGCLNN